MRRLTILFMLSLALFLAACESADPNSGSFLGLNAGPTPAVSLDSGIFTASQFLEAWTVQDYAKMYSLISPNARDAYPEAEFVGIYEKIWTDLTLTGLDWQRGNAIIQGTTVVVEYEMRFESSILGIFTDPNRLMRLIPSDEGMRIAWSRMDIFEGWAGGARLQVERFLAGRGNIYDSEGQSMADQNGITLLMYVTKNRIANLSQCINELIPILGREYQDLEDTFARYNLDTRFLIGEIDPENYTLRQARLESACRVETSERRTRRYFADSAPHVVGYVAQVPAEEAARYDQLGYPQGALVGISGVERSWEEALRGEIGNRLSLISATDERLRIITEKTPSPGQSVYLTIDRDLQQGIMETFANAYSFAEPTWASTAPNVQSSPGAAAVVLDVNTGAVLAMVSYPSFSPSVFNPDTAQFYFNPGSIIQEYNTDRRRPLVNRATQGRYPLGSVFKLVSSVAGADSGVVSFDNLNNCTGTWDGTPYGDGIRTDWYRQGHGVLDGRGAIINSCNPYYWQLAVALNVHDPYLLPRYSRLFGFGQPTGIRSVVEDPGYISDPDLRLQQGFTWSQADASNMVIGQGDMAVTPLQVARMIAAIANGGDLPTPYLVERVQLIGEAPIYQASPELQNVGVDPNVLATVRQAMCNVTLNGTAAFIFQRWYEFHNYPFVTCGKTGTAQAGNNKPHAWYGAYAPRDNPEIAVVVIVENSCEGSEVAAPIVRRIFELYYGLPDYGFPDIWRSACSEIVIE